MWVCVCVRALARARARVYVCLCLSVRLSDLLSVRLCTSTRVCACTPPFVLRTLVEGVSRLEAQIASQTMLPPWKFMPAVRALFRARSVSTPYPSLHLHLNSPITTLRPKHPLQSAKTRIPPSDQQNHNTPLKASRPEYPRQSNKTTTPPSKWQGQFWRKRTRREARAT